jgi:hypothetical protein
MDTTQATFDGVRKNIVEYLSANPTFKDYNFTAPAISTLIDALAYTSHYLIRYANFSLNECFLDTAQLRSNVVSHAKELGYIPHQYKAAKVKLRLRIKDTIGSSIKSGLKLPVDTTFLATTADTNKTYTFRTTEQYMFVQDDNKSWYADIEAVEGTFVTESFLQDEYYTTKYYLINDKVDTNYMTVTVYASQSDTVGFEYTPVRDITSFDDNAKIYFIQEATNGKVEVYFGDGRIAEKLTPYSIIKVKYLVTNGSKANNIVSFTMNNNISSAVKNTDISIEVLAPSSDGADREDIESIRYTAPKFYQAQDRAVTISDYNALLINEFGGWIDSLVSWGGEDNIPPQYSAVFVCAKPKYTDVLSPSQRENIIAYLNKKNMPCIDIIIVDPSYIEVNIALDVDWYAYKTTKQKEEISQLIEDTIRNFFHTNSTGFSSKFKYSKFLTAISDIDKSIDSILTKITLKQYLSPTPKLETSYRLEFLNHIEPGSVLIGPWVSGGAVYKIEDKDADGNLYVSSSYGAKKLIGRVNYEDGIVSINNYMFNSGEVLEATCTPHTQNINTSRNYLLKLTDITIDINENI